MFCAAFDILVTVVPLKVALGLEIFDFWAFQKNNHEESLDGHLCDYFLKCPKINVFPIIKPLLIIPLSQSDQKLPKTIETPQLK